ncbi:hypothetical protein [Janthinobacterium sp. 17J80-10]|uniref:hypothetical protein n=1 Tax=Janthinobacterium sp. 17J80-10 TaxID=2497863 RepID=UPI001005A6DE|nr:hypothetical protein [Janthinobacterium sp. 17J80-10]QAU33315.1 hypothetical protein EKL02_03470 [Janthinobacterium sp. 17J80-10]
MSTSSETSKNAPPEIHPGDAAFPGTPGTGEDVCPRCKGTGMDHGQDCPDCGGTGRIVEGIGGG